MAGHRGNRLLVPTAWVLLLMISAMLLGKVYFHLLKVQELRLALLHSLFRSLSLFLSLSLLLEALHVLSDWIQRKEQSIWLLLCKQTKTSFIYEWTGLDSKCVHSSVSAGPQGHAVCFKSECKSTYKTHPCVELIQKSVRILHLVDNL